MESFVLMNGKMSSEIEVAHRPGYDARAQSEKS
jgi:hypothetical protein